MEVVIKQSMSSVVIRPIQQHKCSNIHLFFIYVTCFVQHYRPSSSDVTET
jgi:hypothetical protein